MNNFHFLFNAEYDFELRSGVISPKIKNAVEGMTPLFAPALHSGDAVLSDAVVDDSFYLYLKDKGISTAPLVKAEQIITPLQTAAEAWGWSKNACGKVDSLKYKRNSPDSDLCRKVNSREFSSHLADKYEFGVPGSTIISSIEELNEYLTTREDENFVLKPLFGNSGAGFLFFSRETLQNDLSRIKNLISSERVLVEPWLKRTADLASLFKIQPNGECEIIGHHRNICNRSGAFYGTLITDNSPVIKRYSNTLEMMIETISKELHSLGYFGIVSVDSFCFLNDNVEEIALAIDINCRYTMSYIAHVIYRKLNVPALFYRFIARKRHVLPETYGELSKLIGSAEYSAEKKTGVILMSPLRIIGSDNVKRQPPRTAFAVVGQTEEDVFQLDQDLLNKMAATKK